MAARVTGGGRHVGPVPAEALTSPADTLASPADTLTSPADTLTFEELAGTDPGLAPRDDLGLDDPAWILYTSGTTGKSKGAISTQRSALWAVAAAYVPAFGLRERDRLLWPLPMFHAYAHSLCLLGVVSVGASAHLLDRGANVAQALAAQPFTMLAGVPATYRLLLDSLRETPAPVPPSLRVCLTGGAAPPRRPPVRRRGSLHGRNGRTRHRHTSGGRRHAPGRARPGGLVPHHP
ncbi:hypothetical protein B1C81_38665 [Streptomyces sp. HG99]|nr:MULTISPECIES: long-chain fatty acid--CoA ligase [Streptomyces]PIB00270.1 hypothetical protein B1C81_38665 [Streptomyces sp. HG99]